MLQRIYGTALFKKDELDAHLHRIEEAKKRDHRGSGASSTCSCSIPSSPGAAFWTERGTTLYNPLVDFVRERQREAFHEIKTPLLYNKALWEISGTGASTARTCSSCSTTRRASTTCRSSR